MQFEATNTLNVHQHSHPRSQAQLRSGQHSSLGFKQRESPPSSPACSCVCPSASSCGVSLCLRCGTIFLISLIGGQRAVLTLAMMHLSLCRHRRALCFSGGLSALISPHAAWLQELVPKWLLDGFLPRCRGKRACLCAMAEESKRGGGQVRSKDH